MHALWAVHASEMKILSAAGLCFPSPVRLLAQSQPPNLSWEGERAMPSMLLADFGSRSDKNQVVDEWQVEKHLVWQPKKTTIENKTKNLPRTRGCLLRHRSIFFPLLNRTLNALNGFWYFKSQCLSCCKQDCTGTPYWFKYLDDFTSTIITTQWQTETHFGYSEISLALIQWL